MGKLRTGLILEDATASGVGGATHVPWDPQLTFHAIGATTAGAGAAEIRIDGSNAETPDANDWTPLGTITLVLATTKSSDGFAINAPWGRIRAVAVGVSGTGASVDVLMAGEVD